MTIVNYDTPSFFMLYKFRMDTTPCLIANYEWQTE